MQTYSFTAILKDHSECSEEMADALFEAGVDDALIGSSYHRETINFGREAESFTAAIQSANQDIRKAGFQMDRIEFDPSENGFLNEVHAS